MTAPRKPARMLHRPDDDLILSSSAADSGLAIFRRGCAIVLA
jgi:hypothetical protein